MAQTVLLAEMTREQIRTLAPRATAVIPVAAIEQHGPHLPIVTDSLACAVICQRAAELAAEQTAVLVTPPLHFGFSHHHFPQPGVLSLSTTTFIQVLRELGDSLARSGFPRIVILNGHGGNEEAARVAAREINIAQGVSVAAASYWTLAWDEIAAVGSRFNLENLPGHAGAFETSLVLALRPDLVDRSAIPPSLGAPGVSPNRLRPTIARAGANLGAGPGYTDSPEFATAEAGEIYLDVIVRAVASFLITFASSS